MIMHFFGQIYQCFQIMSSVRSTSTSVLAVTIETMPYQNKRINMCVALQPELPSDGQYYQHLLTPYVLEICQMSGLETDSVITNYFSVDFALYLWLSFCGIQMIFLTLHFLIMQYIPAASLHDMVFILGSWENYAL